MATRNYAVIDRDGFFRDITCVYSAHSTEAKAVEIAKRHRVGAQFSAMVIRSDGGFTKGEKVYRDTIRRLYPVIW